MWLPFSPVYAREGARTPPDTWQIQLLRNDRRMHQPIKAFLADITRPPRRAARKVLDTRDRLLHPTRHRRTREAVISAPANPSLLFVCLGNICRSPYAEARLRQFLRGGSSDRSTLASGGFILPGRPAPEMALGVSSDLGLDLREHRSQVVTEASIRETNLVFVMTSDQARRLRRMYGRPDILHLGDLDPQFSGRRDIRDPLDQPEEVFREVYARIDRALITLRDALRESPGRLTDETER